jgi:hypothetical protein
MAQTARNVLGILDAFLEITHDKLENTKTSNKFTEGHDVHLQPTKGD